VKFEIFISDLDSAIQNITRWSYKEIRV